MANGPRFLAHINQRLRRGPEGAKGDTSPPLSESEWENYRAIAQRVRRGRRVTGFVLKPQVIRRAGEDGQGRVQIVLNVCYFPDPHEYDYSALLPLLLEIIDERVDQQQEYVGIGMCSSRMC